MKINQIQKTLFRKYYLKEGFSEVTSSHWRDFGEKTIVTRGRNGFEFRAAEHFEWMQNLPISLFINVASMGEMDMPVINRYFEYMRTSTVASNFYCCNREEKTLPDGSVICFDAYPWGSENIVLDELCPWYQKAPSSRPPFWRPFDGPFRHRLVKLKS